MSNKVTTYLLYAIGEIFLVVIGILIAVSINNWNQRNNEKEAANKLMQTLIIDLQRDTAQIHQSLAQIETGIQKHEAFQKKLTSKALSDDSVVSIIRSDFHPFIHLFPGFNDNTYRTMLSTGQINFLDDSTRNILSDLYLKQKNRMALIDDHVKLYASNLFKFGKRYPQQYDFVLLNKGPLHERLWSEYEFLDLLARVNATQTSIRNLYRFQKDFLTDIESETHTVLEVLNQKLN